MAEGTDDGRFTRSALPPCFGHLDRLWHALEVCNLDGIVASTGATMFSSSIRSSELWAMPLKVVR